MIHKYAMNGFNIVLDIHSGAVHVVDDMVFALLDVYSGSNREAAAAALKNRYAPEELAEAIGEIDSLIQQKVLFTEDIYETVAQAEKNSVIKALCLHVAHDCNLKCRYCFAQEGEYHGKRSLMSADVGKKALDFLISHSGERRNLEVDFFGGEPLMNFDVVKEVVDYGRQLEKAHNKNFRFTITTNGVLLDEAKQAFIQEHMSNVVLSLDGRKDIHDHMRPLAGGQGSYDSIVPKFQNFVAQRKDKDYFVRGTFTKHNLNFAEDVFHLADLGFDKISVEPVVGFNGEDYAIQEEDLDAVCAEYEKLAVAMAQGKHSFHFFHFQIDLTGGPCVYKRITGCGAGCEYLAVTPEGEIYPCHQFVGKEGFRLGHVAEAALNRPLMKQFSQVNVYSKPQCRECFAKFYCSGGCMANGYEEEKKLSGIYDVGCKLQQKRVECAIMLKVAASFS